MSYTINKSDGSVLTTLIDGTIDETTDLTLIGKNFSGFGEYINENLVKLLESFASTSAPEKPIIGQLWYDKAEGRLKVYTTNGGWKSAGGPVVSDLQPLIMNTGDMWIDSKENQLWFFDGLDMILAGPTWGKSQGKTGYIAETLYDDNGNPKSVLNLYVADMRMGIFSADQFIPVPAIPGFPTLVKGFNTSKLISFVFDATVTNTLTLNGKNDTQFLRSDANATTIGKLTIQNDSGLAIGDPITAELSVSGSTFSLENIIADGDISIQFSNVTGTNYALYADASTSCVGIFTASPQQSFNNSIAQPTLDVAGSVIIRGDLTVEKDLVTIHTEEMVVEDNNITLGSVPTPTDVTADGGGITIKGDTDKTIEYTNSTQSFTFSEHVDLAAGKSFKINGTTVLTATSLSSAITSAPGITTFGPQAQITVDDIYINDNKISITSTDTDLELEPNGAGNVVLIGSPKITGLADPVDPQDAATRAFVEDWAKTSPISISIIDNGLSPLNSKIALFLTDVANPSSFADGKQAFVHIQTLTYSAPDINVARSLKKFEIVSGAWAFVSDLTSSI